MYLFQTRASSTGGSSTASGGSGLSSMLGGGGGNIPQTLDQLLERQWEQGSQFLMEQAQHFDSEFNLPQLISSQFN